MTRANDDEAIPVPLTPLSGEATTVVTGSIDDDGAPSDPEVDVSSEVDQRAVALYFRAKTSSMT